MPRPSLPPAALRSRAFRLAAFAALWLVLHGGGLGGLAAGAMAAAGAAWLSLILLPPGRGPIVVRALARLVLRFPLQSLRAGLDVARRALAPSLPLRPGLVPCPTRLPAGTGRDAFHAYLSLQPGTLPVGMGDESTLLVHTLDRGAPVAAAVAAEEAAFTRLRRRADD